MFSQVFVHSTLNRGGAARFSDDMQLFYTVVFVELGLELNVPQC